MNLIKDPIITSMLDDDTYKFSQQMAFLELFPDAIGEYAYTNRGKQRFNGDFFDTLDYQLQECLPALKATDDEIHWFSGVAPFLKPWYFDVLRNFRYEPKRLVYSLTDDKNLDWRTDGTGVCWKDMMWEVKVMALISEIFFKTVDTNWTMDGVEERARAKSAYLSANECVHVDFGARRRRSYATQDCIVRTMKEFCPPNGKFVGTSNVHLSMKHGLIPKGTQAHEWFMAMQALEGIRNSNYYALNNWVRVYNGSLGIALPDTLGLKQFLRNFSLRYAKLFDGVRWDSGDPFWFVNMMVAHYKSLGIDPLSKTIVFSNALDCERAVKIAKYCEGKIKASFGIGTFFTNDFDNSPALNMVIKLWSVNDIPVVKLSDDNGKVMGDRDAVRATKWIVLGEPLDSNKE